MTRNIRRGCVLTLNQSQGYRPRARPTLLAFSERLASAALQGVQLHVHGMAQLTELWRLARKLIANNIETVRAHSERRRFLSRHDIDWQSFPEELFATHEPVFVLSTGRCGTALLTSILSRVSRVICEHSPTPELVAIERHAHEHGVDQFDAYRTAISAARFDLISEAHLRGRRYIETNCRITFFAPHLADLFPRARFIHLVRHPGDFVRSAVRRGYYEGRYFDMGRIMPRTGRAAGEWQSMNPFERTAWLWNETNQFIERFKSTNSDRVLTVKAEDLFANPQAPMNVLDFLQLPLLSPNVLGRCLRQPVNQQVGGSVSPVNEWERDRIHRVLRWAPLTYHYGYEFHGFEQQRLAS